MTFLKKILLLDEQPQSTAAIRAALESTGRYVIREEHDTRRAAGAAQWFQPDLILCDSPAGGDAALLRELQARSGSTPIVCVQSSGRNAVASAGLISGYSFFAAPLAIEQLLDCVQELLS